MQYFQYHVFVFQYSLAEIFLADKSELFCVPFKREDKVREEYRFAEIVESDITFPSRTGIMQVFISGRKDPEFTKIGVIKNIFE